MATATLLLHAILCLGAAALGLSAQRSLTGFLALGPGGEAEDLDELRRRARGLAWTIPALFAAIVGAILLAAKWAPQWRASAFGAGLLGLLVVLAGLNAIVASARASRREWSAEATTLGYLAALFGSGVALAIFGLTLFWRFG
jgi:hypothetical protein